MSLISLLPFAGSSQIIAQYYQLIRLGFEVNLLALCSLPLVDKLIQQISYTNIVLLLQGYKNVMENCRDTAKMLKEEIEKTGRFNIVSKDVGVPVVAFSLKDSSSNYTVFDIAENLRRFGWIVPAYTMPADAEHVAVLRVVVREDFSRSLADRLVSNIQKVLDEMHADPVPVSSKSAHVTLDKDETQGNKAVIKKDVVEIQKDITKYWKKLVDRSKARVVC